MKGMRVIWTVGFVIAVGIGVYGFLGGNSTALFGGMIAVGLLFSYFGFFWFESREVRGPRNNKGDYY